MKPRGEPHERVAQALRQAPPTLDDLARARLERAIVEGTGRDVLAPPASPRRRATKGLMVAVTLTAIAASVGLGVWLGTTARIPSQAADPFASGGIPKELMEASLVAEGMPAQGETLRTGSGQRMRAHVAASQVELEPNTRAQFERMAPEELRVRLHGGAVRVRFHPQLGSGQRMVVTTDAARVEVVGTVFRVEVDGAGATGVWVDSGRVRVVPVADADRAIMVEAGQSTRVERDGDVTPVGEDEPASAHADGPDEGGAGDESADGPVEDADGDGLLPGSPPAADDTPTERNGTASESATAEPASAERSRGDRHAAEPTDDRHRTQRARRSRQNRRLRGRVELPGGDHLPAFGRARRLLNARRYAEARRELQGLAASDSHDRTIRTRAWVMIAESHEEQGHYSQAAQAYGKASWFGARTRAGLHALFMLGQLREGRLGDTHGARNAYERYLREAPHGPDAAEVRQGLCRLGDRQACY